MPYTYVGPDAGCLESGRPLVHGETVALEDIQDAENNNNVHDADQRLIDAGLLIPTPEAPDSTKAAPVTPDPNSKEPDAPRA